MNSSNKPDQEESQEKSLNGSSTAEDSDAEDSKGKSAKADEAEERGRTQGKEKGKDEENEQTKQELIIYQFLLSLEKLARGWKFLASFTKRRK